MTLLRHTTPEIKPRKALTINPAKTCQPIGAMYAALGIRGCLPHSHGSQGCCAYHRSALTRHYKEPVMAGTSSFTEGSSVFGGQANLLQALENIFAIYEPDVVAVHTTCLSETIGDDIPQIVAKARQEGKVPDGKHVIYANTPELCRLPRHRVRQHGQGHGPRLCPKDRQEERTRQPHPGLRRARGHGRDQASGRGPGSQIHPLPGHLGSTERAAHRPVLHVPRGRGDRGRAESQRRRHRHPGPGRMGLGRGRPLPRFRVQGALQDTGPAHRAQGHGPLRGHPAPAGRQVRARVHQLRARAVGGRDQRLAPVLLPQEGGPGRRSGPDHQPGGSSW